MNKSKQLFLYIVAFFLIGLLAMLYFILQNTPKHVGMFQDESKESSSPVLERLNTANTFVKQGEYQRALRHLESVAARSLNKKQTQSLYLIKAQANQQLGLYHTALGYAQKANAIREHVLAYLIEANVHRRMNQTNKALRLYRKAMKKFPTSLAPYEHLGNFFFTQGRYEEALRLYRMNGESSMSPSKPMLLKQAICLRLLGETSASSGLIEASLMRSRTAPYKGTTALTMALNEKDLGRPSKAEAFFAQATEALPRPAKPFVAYLNALNILAQGRTNDAIELLSEGARRGDDVEPLSKTLGLLYLLVGEPKRSAFHLRKVSAFDAEAAYYEGVAVYRVGDLRRAIKLFDDFREANPSMLDHNYSAVLLSASAYAGLGYATVWPSMLRRAIEESPSPGAAALAFGQLYLRHLPDQFASAVAPYADDFPELKRLLAFHFKSRGEWSKALGHLLDLSQTEPKNISLLASIADLRLQTGRYSEATSLYRSLLARSSELSPSIRLSVAESAAYAAARLGRTAAAYAFLSREFRRLEQPTDEVACAFHHNLALLAGAIKKPSSEAHFEQAKKLLSDGMDARLRALVWLEAASKALSLDRPSEAVRHIRAALAAEPGNTRAQLLLDSLRLRSSK